MECYRIGKTLLAAGSEELGDGLALILLDNLQEEPLRGVKPPNCHGARFCKAERRRECLWGTVVLPGRSPFSYAVDAGTIVILDEGNLVRPILRQMAKERTWREPGFGAFFWDLWELLLAGDLREMDELDVRVTKLENAVLSGAPGDFHHKLMALRREVTGYLRCYAQMEDMLYKFLENGNDYFTQEDLRLFQLLRERMGRFHSQAQDLREHCLQVWELFQAELDLRQNRIMKILTVVTTVFLPLTLVVGWYGMNFSMPEIQWEYGYPMVIAVSILVVLVTVWICKKKKFW